MLRNWFMSAILLFGSVYVMAGNPDSPAAPDDANSAMFTLEDIYNRLQSGLTGTMRGVGFVEPASGPGATMFTLNQTMALAPMADDTNGAVPGQVLSGKTYWSLRTDGTWGLQTGSGSIAGGAPAKVEKTGQTTQYSPGDDGDLEKGVAWASPRFTDNGDGTVTDNNTGLIWLKQANAIGNLHPTFDADSTAGDGRVFWQHALDFVTALNAGTYDGGVIPAGTYTDWRLPNEKELSSLIDLGYYSPALSNAAGTAKWTEGDAFSGVVSDHYWSSTTYALGTGDAWVVNLYTGHVNAYYKTSSAGYVWPVRGGE